MNNTDDFGRFLKKSSGIILIDKPEGISSNQVLNRFKGMAKARLKIGHTGTLDPAATGMLPVVLNQATKFSQYLLAADKEYLVTAKLGVKTASGDSEGEEIAHAEYQHVTAQQIQQVLENFKGEILQKPPMYSAIKHNGQPLYKLARQGIEVERKAKAVTIFEIELLNFNEDEFSLRVLCSKGTYIRTLIDEIGEQLQSYAHVSSLRRTYVNPFKDCSMLSMERLQEICDAKDSAALAQWVLPIDLALGHWPKVTLSQSLAYYLRQGQAVFVPKIAEQGQVALYKDQEFLGIGEVLEDGKVAPKRLLAAA